MSSAPESGWYAAAEDGVASAADEDETDDTATEASTEDGGLLMEGLQSSSDGEGQQDMDGSTSASDDDDGDDDSEGTGTAEVRCLVRICYLSQPARTWQGVTGPAAVNCGLAADHHDRVSPVAEVKYDARMPKACVVMTHMCAVRQREGVRGFSHVRPFLQRRGVGQAQRVTVGQMRRRI